MADITPEQAALNAAAQLSKDKDRRGLINGPLTPEATPEPEAERLAADKARQSIEVSELEKILGIKIDASRNQVEEVKKIYLEKAPAVSKNEGDWTALVTACVATGVSKEWIKESNRQLNLVSKQPKPSHTSTLPTGAEYEKAMLIKEIEQVLGIKYLPGVNQPEEIQKIYAAKAPQAANDREAWQSKFLHYKE